MTKQITLEELLKLVTVQRTADGKWRIDDVKSTVSGTIYGNVYGNVRGIILGDVYDVGGTIKGRKWGYADVDVDVDVDIETPKETLQRLIEEGAGTKRLLEAFYRLEDN